ncbi:MAG: phosphatidylserine decarboxylase family protein [Acidaminococcaceae bacterium]
MKRFSVVKDGYPHIIIFILLAFIVAYFFSPIYAVIPVVLAIYLAYFFRNPSRITPPDDRLLYSPADGTVMAVEDFYDDEYLDEDAVKVTIFLSVFNVHVNRSPMRGQIKYQRYTCGGFVPAYKKAASFENERHAIGLENDKSRILVIQIAGLIARRIVSWTTLGHNLEQGQCYGMIKFGSSTELVMPKSVDILVKKGDKVKGGITVIGRFKD